MIILFFLILKAQTAKPGFATKTLWSKVFLSPRMLKQFISLGENKHYCTLSGICLVSEHVLFAAQPPLRDIPPSSISRLFIVAAVWVLVSALWSFFFFFKPPSWLLNPNLSPALVCSVSQYTSKPFVGVVVAQRETKQNYKWWANIHDNMCVCFRMCTSVLNTWYFQCISAESLFTLKAMWKCSVRAATCLVLRLCGFELQLWAKCLIFPYFVILPI